MTEAFLTKFISLESKPISCGIAPVKPSAQVDLHPRKTSLLCDLPLLNEACYPDLD